MIKEAYSKNGGLHVDSKWYQEQEYQDVIEKHGKRMVEKYIVLRMRMPEERKNLWIPTESETVGMRMHWRCLQMSF